LLPILKETIDILFAKGLLIKVLFANTETFAMAYGVEHACFTSARKYDGKEEQSVSFFVLLFYQFTKMSVFRVDLRLRQ
jgi:superfamily II RNA helicase